jgi:quinoprotein glucose dehydrogenase
MRLRGKRRLFVATIDARLFALDAGTGRPIPTFANDGHYDLTQGLRLPPKGKSEFEETSAPAIIGDVIVVGSAIADNARTDMPSGEVRAFDVRTGKLLWTFDPMPGTKIGAANAWSAITPDPANNLVFVPTGSALLRPSQGRRAGQVAQRRRVGVSTFFISTKTVAF